MAQRGLSAICPLAASQPHPLAQNRDVEPARPIHSLFRWHKSHYKNFTKESWELKRPLPASAPELPEEEDKREERKRVLAVLVSPKTRGVTGVVGHGWGPGGLQQGPTESEEVNLQPWNTTPRPASELRVSGDMSKGGLLLLPAPLAGTVSTSAHPTKGHPLNSFGRNEDSFRLPSPRSHPTSYPQELLQENGSFPRRLPPQAPPYPTKLVGKSHRS